MVSVLYHSCLCCLAIQIHHTKYMLWYIASSLPLVHSIYKEVQVAIVLPQNTHTIPNLCMSQGLGVVKVHLPE